MRWTETIERSTIRVYGLLLNDGGTLNNRGNFSSRKQVATVIAAMGKVDGNIPVDWIPQPQERRRAPNKGKRSR